MTNFTLTIIRVPNDPQNDLIHRTHTVKARSQGEAELRCVVEGFVSTMDNVIDWYARPLSTH